MASARQEENSEDFTATLARRSRQFRFSTLLASLILLLTLYPYLGTGLVGTLLLNVLLSLILFAALFALGNRRRILIALSLLAGLTLIAVWPLHLLGIPSYVIAENLFSILFYSVTTVAILHHVLIRPEITPDSLAGVVAVYLLMGISWAAGYTLIESLDQASFYIDPVLSQQGPLAFTDFIYYSFITLTTTGYGDIIPVTSPARSLAFLEAVIGTLYIAVLIARFVGVLSGSLTVEEK